MCDFAPRQNYDFAAAIRDANRAVTGLFTPTRAIVSDTVCLITDPSPSGDAGRESSSTPAQRFPDRTDLSSAGAAAGVEGEGGR